MANVEKTPKGFHIKKDTQDLKKEQIADTGKKANKTQTDRLERCELMLELLCAERGIKID